MRITLINPSWGGRVRGRRFNRGWPPLDLLNTAAVLRSAGFEIYLCDARADGASPDRLSSRIADSDLVVLTTSPLDRWQCPNIDLDPLWEWTKAIPKEKLIVYGAHGTQYPEAVLRRTSAGFVIRGEPENTVPELCRALSRRDGSFANVGSISYLDRGEIRHTPSAPPVDLSALPIPAYDLVRRDRYEYEPLGKDLAVLETARGCPHRCSFCCFKVMYGPGVRYKPLDLVRRDVLEVSRLGYTSIYFMDLEFCMNRSRAIEICRIMKGLDISWCCQTRVDAVDPDLLREMARSGCRLVHYGIESGGRETLRRMGKDISVEQMENAVRWAKSANLATAGFFLFGFPGEPAAEREKTERLARKLNLTYASFHVVTPYAGAGPESSLHSGEPWWEEENLHRPDPSRRLLLAHLRYCLRPAYFKELFLRGSNHIATGRLFLDFLKDGLQSRQKTGKHIQPLQGDAANE